MVNLQISPIETNPEKRRGVEWCQIINNITFPFWGVGYPFYDHQDIKGGDLKETGVFNLVRNEVIQRTQNELNDSYQMMLRFSGGQWKISKEIDFLSTSSDWLENTYDWMPIGKRSRIYFLEASSGVEDVFNQILYSLQAKIFYVSYEFFYDCDTILTIACKIMMTYYRTKNKLRSLRKNDINEVTEY